MIAVIVSRLVNNIVCMFNFLGRVKKLTLAAVVFKVEGNVRARCYCGNDRASSRQVDPFVMHFLNIFSIIGPND